MMNKPFFTQPRAINKKRGEGWGLLVRLPDVNGEHDDISVVMVLIWLEKQYR